MVLTVLQACFGGLEGGLVVEVVELRWMGYVYWLKCVSRGLVACLDLDRIFDFCI